MSSESSEGPFRRFIIEKHSRVQQSLQQLLVQLVFDAKAEKLSAANQLSSALATLRNNLSAKDRPSWIDQLEKALGNFKDSPDSVEHRTGLLNRLTTCQPLIASHQWSFSDGEDSPVIDFDSISREARSESRIPEIFDSLIKLLEECLSSDELDSVKARAAIERLLATLRAKESRTFFGMVTTSRFTQQFIRNWLIGELKKLPIAGSVVEAFLKAADDLAEEDALLLQSVNDRTRQLAQTEFEKLPGEAKLIGQMEALRLPDLTSE
jgi:hypothetical protein